MADIPASALTAAANALMLAGRWADALALLDAARPSEAERSPLAVAAAGIAIEQDFWIITSVASRYLDAASAAVADGQRWYLDFLILKRDYNEALHAMFSAPEPALPDPGAAAVLGSRARDLRATAPDEGGRAWAAFYAGLIEDLLRGDISAAVPDYTSARDLGEQAGDELIVSYAVRHLGYAAARSGDRDAAWSAFERSLELRQRAGCVPHVLAQYLALAEMAAENGDAPWARTVAALVRDWAATAGVGTRWLASSAAEIAKA